MYVSLLLAATLVLLPGDALADTPSFRRSDVASVEGARGMAVADFDRNGWADVAFANAARNTVTILLNAEGTLTLVHDVPVGGGPFDITAADFDRDGTVDLAVVTADANRWFTLYGRGDGTFAVEENGHLSDPRGITSADMNRDGRPDLIITNFVAGSVDVFLSSPTGFVGGGGFIGYASRPQGVAAGDFNRDGHTDMAVAYEGAGSVAVIYGNGSPNGYRASGLPGAGPMNVIAAGDFNHDGWDDLAAASSGGNRVALFLGSADGFRLLRTIATGSSPRDIVAADVNLDGRIDLLTANHGSSSVSVMLGTGDAAVVGAPFTVAAGRGSRALAVADFNIDGLPDIATGNQHAPNTTVLTNATALPQLAYAFDAQHVGTGSLINHAANDAGVADFDHDGRPDVATRGAAGRHAVAVLVTGRAPVSLVVDGDIRRFWVADLNNDRNDDVLIAFDQSGVRFRTYLGSGNGGFVGVDTGAAPPALREFDLADANGDGYPDVLFVSGSSSLPFRLGTWFGAGNGTFSGEVTVPVPGLLSIAAAADVNRDGDLDVVTSWMNELAIWTGDGTGRFASAQRIVPPGINWVTHTRVGDLNHDGFPDLAAATHLGFAILLGSGNGFTWDSYASPWPSYLHSGNPFALADLDVDGHLDLVVSTFADGFFGESHTMRGTGTGTFLPGERFVFAGSQIRVADFNADGTPDVLTTPSFGTVTVALNLRGAINRNPELPPLHDATFSYQAQYEDGGLSLEVTQARDPDLHALTYLWHDDTGAVVSDTPWLSVVDEVPGTHRYTVTVFDGRGGSATGDLVVTLTPLKEIVLHTIGAIGPGWNRVFESGAASGMRLHDPNRRAPKINAPLASPPRYAHIGFVADPTQMYKLWVRLKADGNSPYNDSAWLQISGAVDASGATYLPGTTAGLAVNLEECAGCGVSGWGWEDDGWGAPNRHGVLLRFPGGGPQLIRIQPREDGVSIDQIVLSAEKYLTTRPGAAKNDSTMLPYTYWQPLED